MKHQCVFYEPSKEENSQVFKFATVEENKLAVEEINIVGALDKVSTILIVDTSDKDDVIVTEVIVYDDV